MPNEYYSGEGCLSLPKLNLQFLTLHDYLLRNCNLFRLESTFEIRQDIEDAVSRMLPWKDEEGDVMFAGWARMVSFAKFRIVFRNKIAAVNHLNFQDFIYVNYIQKNKKYYSQPLFGSAMVSAKSARFLLYCLIMLQTSLSS